MRLTLKHSCPDHICPVKLLLIRLCVLFATSSCGGSDFYRSSEGTNDGGEILEHDTENVFSSSKILNGTKCIGETFRDVFYLETPLGADNFVQCSGLLIYPGVILTAAHCVSHLYPTNNPPVYIPYKGIRVSRQNDIVNPPSPNQFTMSAFVYLYPGAFGVSSDLWRTMPVNDNRRASDMAMVVLSRPLEPISTPNIPLPSSAYFQIKSTVVGYGPLDQVGTGNNIKRYYEQTSNAYISNSLLSSGDTSGGPWFGDSGGPIYSGWCVPNNCNDLIGIVGGGSVNTEAGSYGYGPWFNSDHKTWITNVGPFISGRCEGLTVHTVADFP